MCIPNIHSEAVSGQDLYDFNIRKHFESIMDPLVMQKLNLHLDLEPHVYKDDLKVCFYDFPHRVKLWVPIRVFFSIEQMLERIYEQYEKDLPSLIEKDSSESISILRDQLNKKFKD